MKNILISAFLTLSMLTLAGCYGSTYNKSEGIKTTKACASDCKKKCCAKKCDAKITTNKCGASGKCGQGKCGSAK